MAIALYFVGAVIFFMTTLHAEQKRGRVMEATPEFIFIGMFVSLFWPILAFFWIVAWASHRLHKPQPPKDWP